MTPRVVVVTGASAGVGRAACRAFAQRGDSVVLVARGREGLEAAAKEVEAVGSRALMLTADVADASAVEAVADEAERAFGPIDVWVNNAMTTVFSEFADLESEEFRRVTEVTYLGCVYGTMTALRRMLPRDRGIVIQVGSALAYRAIPLQSAYCGAKHAIKGFTESLRCELLHHGSGVRVVMVQLPGLNTPQFDICRTKMTKLPQPVAPILQPEIAAEAIVSASEDPRPEIFVGGSTTLTILGNRIAPRLIDRYLARTGYSSQQRDEPVRNGSEGNLFAPTIGDQGAHGSFDRRAKRRSIQWMLRKTLRSSRSAATN